MIRIQIPLGMLINTITLIIIIQPSTDLYWCILCIQAGDTWNNDRQTHRVSIITDLPTNWVQILVHNYDN